MTRTNFPLTLDVNWPRFDTACNIVHQARDGLISILLTGKGEPTLHPKLIEKYLLKLKMKGDFPLIDLQTNGIIFDPRADSTGPDHLKRWRDLGLTLVCISLAHYSPIPSNSLMRIHGALDYDYRRAIETAHKLGLVVRLNYTLLKCGLHTPEDMEEAIRLARLQDVEQLTFREATMPYESECEETAAFVKEQRPEGACKKLFHHLELNGANRLPNLAHGAALFDYDGQNVSINNCLTETLDSDDIRQIIFFPNGEICYDWKYRGARLL